MIFPISSAQNLRILPCVVFFAPVGDSEQRSETMLAIAHRSGRLPVKLMSGFSVAGSNLASLSDTALTLAVVWSCADGIVEQIAVASEHPDLSALWAEIKGLGLLVSEFMDTNNEDNEDKESRESLLEMAPVGYWILNQKGSKGWFSQSN